MASCRLQRVLENDLGQPVLYFVNTKTRLGEAIEVVKLMKNIVTCGIHTCLMMSCVTVFIFLLDFHFKIIRCDHLGCVFSNPGLPHDTGEIWGHWGCSGLASGCRLDVMWTDPPISQQLFFEDLDMEAPLQGEDVGGKPEEKTWHPEERILGFLLEVIEGSSLNPIAI